MHDATKMEFDVENLFVFVHPYSIWNTKNHNSVSMKINLFFRID